MIDAMDGIRRRSIFQFWERSWGERDRRALVARTVRAQ